MISPDRLCDTTDLRRSFPLDTCEMVMVMVVVMIIVALLLDICHMFILMVGQRMMIIDRNLKVTTACKVVLLPSSQPFGRIPGEPQLISDHHFHGFHGFHGLFCCLFHFWIFFFVLFHCWIVFKSMKFYLTSTDGLKPGPDLVPFAPSHRFTDDHVAVVALVAGGDG